LSEQLVRFEKEWSSWIRLAHGHSPFCSADFFGFQLKEVALPLPNRCDDAGKANVR
jgi:hypothetical protein